MPLLCFGLLYGTAVVHAQGTFQNLDFESANIPPNPGTFIPFTNALPGWAGSRGPFVATDAGYNGVAGYFAEVSILDHGFTGFREDVVIEGNYTAALSAGLAGTGFAATSIYQSSLIPVLARSLSFAARFDGGNVGDLVVSMNGQNLPFYQLSVGPNFQTYGGDISAFAGMMAELRFTEQPHFSHVATTVLLDNIQFSDQPIPEPDMVSLFGLGALLLGWRFLCKRR